jgi:hypothetical protein
MTVYADTLALDNTQFMQSFSVKKVASQASCLLNVRKHTLSSFKNEIEKNQIGKDYMVET